eukprot:COSAG01_NODE_431_length_17124_cov_26.577386_10_plen_121_part_00
MPVTQRCSVLTEIYLWHSCFIAALSQGTPGDLTWLRCPWHDRLVDSAGRPLDPSITVLGESVMVDGRALNELELRALLDTHGFRYVPSPRHTSHALNSGLTENPLRFREPAGCFTVTRSR